MQLLSYGAQGACVIVCLYGLPMCESIRTPVHFSARMCAHMSQPCAEMHGSFLATDLVIQQLIRCAIK